MNSHWIVLISEFSIVVSVIGIVLGTINYKHNKKYLSLLKAGIKEHDYTGNMVQWRENKLQKSSGLHSDSDSFFRTMDLRVYKH